MSDRRILFPALVAASAFAAGCANPTSPPTARVAVATASTPSTQPVIGSCVNDATVEFDSKWSSFRFAEQSNSATVQLTVAAGPAPVLSPPAQVSASRPAGSADARADRGGAAPDAVRGQSSADALRGGADVDAARGYAIADHARGTFTAATLRGHSTVQVVRGGAEAVAAHHDNSSAVVRPDLSVTLRADPAAAAPGDTVVYTIAIKNIGSIEARDVTVTDYLPEQMQALSARGAVITPDPDDTSTHLTVPGSLLPGASAQILLLARVNSPSTKP